ncbi:AraC family transcriptional regulator [Puia dinghuensis]|uniref:AraC family transcriptional regulator n=2 Tax=Puia dinghuensis TaxID=1792502 RepID=A0A8J2UB24_9BACT|nr:AraC family transcriptional regulator [Puia dinghuensis]
MYSFQLENFEKWLEGLAARLNSTVTNRSLSIPAHLGSGTIHAQNINPHLSYAVMNFKLDSDLELHRESGATGFVISFNMVEVQKELLVGHRQQIISDKRPFRNDIFLTDARDSAFVRMTTGSTVRRLLIFCSHELAMQYLPQDIFTKLSVFARENSISDHPLFINLSHRTMLKEIFELKENDPLMPIRRLSGIIHLIEKFLHSFLRQEQAALPRTVKKNDLESMQHVEHILSSRLEGFPSLESLAQEVFMSTSKLKNLFKQVYGHTLYDYYNKSRLQRAKDLLITGQCSIKQAGSEIGFSNLSHFAKAFRKEFGILPRDLVKGR